jgi:hypothetical protein
MNNSLETDDGFCIYFDKVIAHSCRINPYKIVTCILTCSAKDKTSKSSPIKIIGLNYVKIFSINSKEELIKFLSLQHKHLSKFSLFFLKKNQLSSQMSSRTAIFLVRLTDAYVDKNGNKGTKICSALGDKQNKNTTTTHLSQYVIKE